MSIVQNSQIVNPGSGNYVNSTELENLARIAIGTILDGKSPNAIVPSELGRYNELYSEMLRAHQGGGTEAARRVFVAYAERDPAVAALRAADPVATRKKWSVADLYATEFPELEFIVDGFLTPGLNAMGARPKIGKSWFALQAAVAVGTGGMFLNRSVKRGRVLYLALEDSPRRIEKRLKMQQAPGDAMIDFHFTWKPLSGEGLADLAAEIEKHDYKLIIIDTLARALGFIDPNKQAENNVHLGALQRLAVDRGIAVLLIDHHRKSASGDGGGDVIDDQIGATSKAAVLDVSMGLYRKRGERTATFKVTGRDIDESELSVKFDTTTGCWQLVEDGGVREDSIQAEILDALEELGSSATGARIAKMMGRDRSNIRKELQELVAKHKILRTPRSGREVVYKLMDDHGAPNSPQSPQ